MIEQKYLSKFSYLSDEDIKAIQLIDRLLAIIQLPNAKLRLSWSVAHACIVNDVTDEVVSIKLREHGPYYSYLGYYDSANDLLKRLLSPGSSLSFYPDKYGDPVDISISSKFGTSIEELKVNLDLLENKNS